MQEADIQSVKVDETRLMDTLHDTCRFGTGPAWKIKDRRAYHHFTKHTTFSRTTTGPLLNFSTFYHKHLTFFHIQTALRREKKKKG